MKILMVSIFSPHFFNWTNQLRGSGHEVYWLDVFDSNTQVEKIDFVNQITGWRYKWDYPGRHFLKKKAPTITKLINRWNERKLTDVLEEKIKEIKPDVVHSFILQSAGFPILSIMKKYPDLKWIYSAWGSDLYYRQKIKEESEKIIKTLQRVNYMFSDCKRDYKIALKYGFKGKFLGVFPGGGGLDFKHCNQFIKPFNERNVILIKGYQGKHGRCISVLNAIKNLKNEVHNYNVIVFGASPEVLRYISDSGLENWKNFKAYENLPHEKILKLMGSAKVFIGNSLSDGIPNTLLEAIVMEAFPIQSNPGGATAEIIENGKNGFLIENPEDIDEIAALITKALESPNLLLSGIHFNNEQIKPKLEREHIKKKVLEKYRFIEENL